MCGIVGYVGKREAMTVLLDGLKRLEYRGYDSAGLAILNGTVRIKKSVGKLENLRGAVRLDPVEGSIGLGHTRWATHGVPNEVNAHPHSDCSDTIALVHNGIIENYTTLKERLTQKGHVFRSDTDTEVLAHLIEEHFQGNLEEAVRSALLQVDGSYAIGVLSRTDPGKIVAVRVGSPLVVGLGEGEFFIASDIPALLEYTQNEMVLDDGEMAVLSPEGVVVSELRGNRPVAKKVQQIHWALDQAEKGNYRHFMMKEIHEQPAAVRNTLAGRNHPAGLDILLPDVPEKLLSDLERVSIIACGTSFHAGLVGKYWIERLAQIPVEVEYASEFRYRDPLVSSRTLTVSISQSGETADTLAAMKEARSKHSPVVTVCNVIGSSAAREAVGVIYTHAGPEIGVASTKAFTTQLVALSLLSLFLGRRKGRLSQEQTEGHLNTLKDLPRLIDHILMKQEVIERWSQLFWKKEHFLFLGRGISYPIALEGALKLKEISYIHAEGYPAAEMKHGPIALIDEELPVVALIPEGPLYGKMISNIEEVKSRGGMILAVATEGDDAITTRVDHVVHLPKAGNMTLPILQVVPLQLLAYFIASKRGCDVDQPRNLAKSVTVE